MLRVFVLKTFGQRREYVGGSSGSIHGTIHESNEGECSAPAIVCFRSPKGLLACVDADGEFAEIAPLGELVKTASELRGPE